MKSPSHWLSPAQFLSFYTFGETVCKSLAMQFHRTVVLSLRDQVGSFLSLLQRLAVECSVIVIKHSFTTRFILLTFHI